MHVRIACAQYSSTGSLGASPTKHHRRALSMHILFSLTSACSLCNVPRTIFTLQLPFLSVYMVFYVVLHGWIKSAARYYIYQRYIRATQVLYQLPIKTSGEDSCIATNEAIRNFCGGYYRVDDINYLCHVRYGRDITNT